MSLDLPGKKYQVIYADPPWKYSDKAASGKRGASFKYGVMTAADIMFMPVEDIADDNCALFLWVTMPMLREGLATITAWGFEYKTAAFTWVKRNKRAPSWFLGMGNWTRANAELCLLATRGKPKRINAGVRSLIEAPVGAHSAKPAEARERIVDLMGDLPRIELFARGVPADGWDAWGDEVDTGDVGNVVPLKPKE